METKDDTAQMSAAVTVECVISLILGIVSLIMWSWPYIGMPLSILGLISGVLARRKTTNSMIRIAVILCVIALSISIIYLAATSYLAYKGYS
ncbi:hypothetical protein L3V82_08105 [Thiotrichales bacterium 19S3-7]|nr:hypothetical protein [Thiotrichales bacterium 19S3-7]MCF6802123.1 hypothetical protein [Thiotrichales bacterium 19S3-11]